MYPRIGLQTFTIRRFLKTPGAIDSAFARLSGLGIAAVELAYVKLRPEYIDALAAAGRRHGISFCSSQITFRILDRQRDWIVRVHEQLGCSLTAVSVLPVGAIVGGRDTLLAFAGRLEALGQWYRERGIQLCFHHHDYEFRRYGDDIGLDLIMDNSSAQNVCLELDTYWAQRGGRSPQDMIRSLNGRVKVVHLRDFALHRRGLQLRPTDAELGAGNLDIARIVDACRDQQVQLLAIEQNTRTPYESVERSVDHLRALGFESLLHMPTLEDSHDT